MSGDPLVIGTPQPAAWGEATLMGLVVGLLAGTDRRRLSIAALEAWLRVPVRLGQIALLFGDRATPLGYVTWAYVGEQGARRFGAGIGVMPDLEDWNEGSLPWIVDVVAPHGDAGTLLRAVRGHLRQAGHHEIGYSLRRRRNSPARRRLCA